MVKNSRNYSAKTSWGRYAQNYRKIIRKICRKISLYYIFYNFELNFSAILSEATFNNRIAE